MQLILRKNKYWKVQRMYQSLAEYSSLRFFSSPPLLNKIELFLEGVRGFFQFLGALYYVMRKRMTLTKSLKQLGLYIKLSAVKFHCWNTSRYG